MDTVRRGVLLSVIGLCVSGTAYSEPLNVTGGFVVLFDEGSAGESFNVARSTGPEVLFGTDNGTSELLRAEQAGSMIWSSDIAATGIASSTFQRVNGGRWYRFDAPPPKFITFDINPTTPAAVPEPATMVLIGTGLLGLAKITRCRPLKTVVAAIQRFRDRGFSD